MLRASIFILTLALGFVNVLLVARLGEKVVKPEELRTLVAILGAAALAIPAILALALGAFTHNKSSFSTRYVLSFALVHVAGFGLLYQLGGLRLEDASLTFARLVGRDVAERPIGRNVPIENPPRTSPADAGASRQPAPDAGVVFEWTDDDGGRAEDAVRAVRRLNEHRSVAKLPLVELDPELSRRAQLHADYLARNAGHPSLRGLGAHDEIAELAGYTKEGLEAGRSSVITFDARPKVDPVDKWMGTFFHRIPLLRPKLTRTGFGYAKSADPKVGRIWLLHVGQEETDAVVVYPTDGQKDVPTRFSGNETPNPIPNDEDGLAGFPITVTFPPKAKVRGVSVSFETTSGSSIDHYLSTPESPVLEGRQMNTICVIAEDPLEGRTQYAVDIAAIVDGLDHRQRLRFTTAKD